MGRVLMKKTIWLIGPLGMGINFKVENYPQEDNGCMSKSYHQSIVWDCGIIAKLVNQNFSTSLFCNSLGNSIFGMEIKQEFGLFTNLHEVGSTPESPPIDIIINSDQNTRTWISNIKPPKLDDLKFELQKHEEENPLLIYCDFWQEMNTGNNSFQVLEHFHKPILFLNVGDCDSLEIISDVVNKFSCNTNVILQISYKKEIIYEEFMKYFSADNLFAIITRGNLDVLFFSKNYKQQFKVKELHNINTTGAGAIFSAAIIKRLCFSAKRLTNFDKVINDSIEETNCCLQLPSRKYYINY
jgi:hypothetical protein